MPAELRGDKVWVQDQSEANRIFNKGRYGRPRSGGSLELDLVEAAYLLETGRMRLDGLEGLPAFFAAAASQKDFEVRYHVYRELRERGLAPQLTKDGFGFWVAPKQERPKDPAMLVLAMNERASVRVKDLWSFASKAQAGTRTLAAVVDEESEVTVYDLAPLAPVGKVRADTRPAAPGSLMVDRVVVWDEADARRLHQSEFFGKLVGKRLHLSLVEALHLSQHRGFEITNPGSGKGLGEAGLLRLARKIEPGIDQRRAVYDDLKSRGLVVKTGYKFGTHFRAYEMDPVNTHAPFLVQCVRQDDVFEWPQLSRAVRLAHGVRKTLLLGVSDLDPIAYLSMVRAR